MKFDFEFKYKLLDTLFYSWYSPTERFYKNILRIIQYTPLLWSDRDWDHAFFLKMMSFKLKRMSLYHEKYGHAVRSYEISKKIKICAILAERLSNDKYCEKEYDNYFKEYPIGGDFLTFLHRQMVDKERKDVKRIHVKEQYLRQYDKDLLFNMLNKYLEHFCD